MQTVGERKAEGEVSVHAVNVGGIDETAVEFGPGVTVLSGRNATNRSSFLSSIMAAMGSDAATLKADADAGAVELSVGEETYTRRFERVDDAVATDGDPYCADPTLAELFAFLVEDNEARRAVERIDEGRESYLREVLMRPVDTERIEAEIDRLQSERSEVDEELERLEDLERELPEAERERTRLDGEVETTREELAAVRADIDDAEASVDPDDAAEELEERLTALREEQRALEDARFDLETELESVSELRSERSELEDALEETEQVPTERLETLGDRIESLRSERSSLETEINELQSVIGFNEDMLGERTELFATDGDDADVTEQLLGDDASVSCWTCGSTVSVEEVEVTLDHLRSRRQRKIEERSSLGEEIDELEAERSELERRQRRRTELQRKLDSVEAEIDRVQELIADHRGAVREREERVAELEAVVAELEAAESDDDALIELHREAQSLEAELERLEDERATVEERIEELESELDRREELTDRRTAIVDQLEDCRTRVDRIEQSAVDAFNEHMADVLDVLDYDNVERVWIERRQESVREGRRTVEKRLFGHHIVRTAEDGTTYEDAVENLSESEREVIGLVVALAGYLVHDVHESVPFVLMDSLEAIDADRIAALVEYFEHYAEYLVIALLPEDAQALDGDYEYVREI